MSLTVQEIFTKHYHCSGHGFQIWAQNKEDSTRDPVSRSAQVALISKALPPKPSANGSAASMEVDEDLTEDVALRSIDDMGAENQRRCVSMHKSGTSAE